MVQCSRGHLCTFRWHGTCPANDIAIKFEIWPKFAVLWFKMYSTDHNEILHMSRQCNCRDMCKISLCQFGIIKLEHSKCWSNFGFDQNIVSGTAAWYLMWRTTRGWDDDHKLRHYFFHWSLADFLDLGSTSITNCHTNCPIVNSCNVVVEIRNNAWITVNTDFLLSVRQFGNDFHEWQNHGWKLLVFLVTHISFYFLHALSYVPNTKIC